MCRGRGSWARGWGRELRRLGRLGMVGKVGWEEHWAGAVPNRLTAGDAAFRNADDRAWS